VLACLAVVLAKLGANDPCSVVASDGRASSHILVPSKCRFGSHGGLQEIEIKNMISSDS